MEYKLIRKRNNHKMYLRYKDGQVVVSAPLLATRKEIDAFVNKNLDWIEKQKTKAIMSVLKDGDSIPVLNKQYTLHLDPIYKRSHYDDQNIYVSNQKQFERILKELAHPILEYYFNNIGLQLDLNDVRLKTIVTYHQWGSCNKKNREIHLNAYLVMTEPSFIQAVICHEFAHMYVSNHSKDFYDVVTTWMPDYKTVHKKYKGFVFPKCQTIEKDM